MRIEFTDPMETVHISFAGNSRRITHAVAGAIHCLDRIEEALEREFPGLAVTAAGNRASGDTANHLDRSQAEKIRGSGEAPVSTMMHDRLASADFRAAMLKGALREAGGKVALVPLA